MHRAFCQLAPLRSCRAVGSRVMAVNTVEFKVSIGSSSSSSKSLCLLSVSSRTTSDNSRASNFQRNYSKGRKLIIVRHGERIDRVLPDWMKFAWQGEKYVPYDLNMPTMLPRRKSYVDYDLDSALTEVGVLQSNGVGRALTSHGIQIDEVYCSPAYRCIQTATGILKMSRHRKGMTINVEPGLFEFLEWYPQAPRWFTVAELKELGYQVNPDYQPILTVDGLIKEYPNETKQSFYLRCQTITEKILKKHDNSTSTIVIVAHGPHLDASVRPLLKRRFDVPVDRFDDFAILFPFCSTILLAEHGESKWVLAEPQLPCFTYTNFKNRYNHDFVFRP